MSLRRRLPDPMMNDDPSAVGLGEEGLLDDSAALGDPLSAMPEDDAAMTPPGLGEEENTGGLSNEDLANINLGAAVPDDQGEEGALEDPALASLLDQIMQGDPEAQALLDIAARRRMAGGV